MRPAGRLDDAPAPVETLEPTVAVRLQGATEVSQVCPRVLRPSIRAVAVKGAGWDAARVRALVAEVGPEPAGAGPAGARRQHGDGRVVGVQDPAAHDVPR